MDDFNYTDMLISFDTNIVLAVVILIVLVCIQIYLFRFMRNRFGLIFITTITSILVCLVILTLKIMVISTFSFMVIIFNTLIFGYVSFENRKEKKEKNGSYFNDVF